LENGTRLTAPAFVRDMSERQPGERDHHRLVSELRRALDGSQRRFDAIVGSLSDPVTIRDRNHRFLYANRAAIAHLGFDSWEALRDTSPDEIMADYLVSGEDGRDVSMHDIPSVRILRGEPAEPLLIQTVNRGTGARRWQLLKSAPLVDEQGEVEATITIIEDVTEQKRAERQAAFLAEVSEVLASSLDYEQTLKNVAELAVPGIVDWCAVDLLDDEGNRRPVAVAHVDRQRLRLAEQLRAYEPEHLDPEQGLGLVFATGEPLLYAEIPDEMLERTALDERHLELLRAIGFCSAMIVPVRLGARTLGAMTLVSAESGRVLDRFDLELAEQVAARAAVAIENSRLYSERTLVAHTLQQSLLPADLPEIPGYELASIYTPALESSAVGGDFYDVWEVGDSWMMVIGDVTGKGIEAAALTALVRHSLRAVSEFETGPALLLAHVDRALKKRPTLSICTALCLRLRHNTATLALGGHPRPFYVTAPGVTAVGRSGPLLGGFADARWDDLTFEIAPDSTLVTYTDGVTDALGKDGSRYGYARLRAKLARGSDRSAAGVVGDLSRALREFQTVGHADDTAALVLHRSRPASPPRAARDDRYG
jgi:PAS domain S-box-containing protein